MKSSTKLKENIFNIIIILIFAILTLWLGFYHEPWADEAHAWLLAKDSTIASLIGTYLHSDGHPFLWHLILKLAQTLNFKYTDIHFISWFFSVIGVSLFVFKSKFNKFIKYLFPFTYFIFYQYNIVSRGYCLILPLLCLMAIIYDKRHEKCALYTLIMLLMLSTEVYIYLLSGVLFLFYIIEFIKNKYENKWEHIISIVTIFNGFLFTLIYLFPYSTNTFKVLPNPYFISNSFIWPYFEANFYNTFNVIGCLITTAIVMYLLYKIYKGDKNNGIQFVMIIGIMLAFVYIKYSKGWHHGIILLGTLFCMWIHGKEDNKYFKYLMYATIICQIPWSIITSTYDYRNDYTGAQKAAEFIKQYDYKNLNIKGMFFHSSPINAYIGENIYNNYSNEFFYWDMSNKFYDTYDSETFLKTHSSAKYYLDNDVDIFVYGVKPILNDDIWDYYNEYVFKGNLFFECAVSEKREFHVYVRKDIDEEYNK